jgi:hypothetical protein
MSLRLWGTNIAVWHSKIAANGEFTPVALEFLHAKFHLILHLPSTKWAVNEEWTGVERAVKKTA